MRRLLWTLSLAIVAAACGDSATVTDPGGNPQPGGGTPVTMTVLGRGDFKPSRTTGEIFVRGNTAYTTTWGNSSAQSAFYIWDVAADVPKLVDSVKVNEATTIGDVATTADGSHLVIATERSPGSIAIYSLADLRKPVLLSRLTNAEMGPGVHTAEVGRVGAREYAFLSINPGGSAPAKIVIVDITTPAMPVQVYSKFIGTPFVHDTFVRDGLLFLGLWNAGVAIWDIGGGGKGGTPASPVELGSVQTASGEVHNIWWVKDPVTNSSRYAFIGEEGPAVTGSSSSGDVHVVDVSDKANPREVAFYSVPGAGTHNFSVDEPNGILYAAYYNGGVRALDVRGDLGTCTDAQKSTPAGTNVPLCDLRKMGREMGVGLLGRGTQVYIWGVHYQNGMVYASDMINGIWKLRALSRP